MARGLPLTQNYFQQVDSLLHSFSVFHYFLLIFLFVQLSHCLSQGPHIASVTLAAYECGTVDFPEPPYPDQIICPQQEATPPGSDAEHVGVGAAGVEAGSAALQGTISLWTIISKVRLEACMWVSVCCTLAVHTVDRKS